MIKVGKAIAKLRVPIFILALILLVPSALGYVNTRINYDILSYLPKDIATMKGQDILIDQFGTGGFSMIVVENMDDQDVSAMRKKMAKVDHVKDVIWYDSFADLSIPKTMIPKKIYDMFNAKDSTMMIAIFDEGTSSEDTMEAIKQLRKIGKKQAFISGMSAIVTDTKDLSESETIAYVVIAAILTFIVLSITMDSFLIPLFFLLSIGFSIIYNLGTNIFLGEISFITQALTAVLQLAVTMDYSIFLWNSYKEYEQKYPGDSNRAMGHAIAATFSSVVGSSLTTVAGFIALCFMSYRLGLNLGIVMAKGVVLGVICCVTVLPSMILIFEKAIVKTSHKVLLPSFEGLSHWITKHYWVFLIVMLVLLFPAIYCYNHTKVYYALDETLPDSLASMQANKKLQENYNSSAIDILLIDKDMSESDVQEMTKKVSDLKGISYAIGMDSIIGPTIPRSMVPKDVLDVFESDQYQMIMVGTEYRVASDAVNKQCNQIEKIIHSYSKENMLVGEAPCTRDLIKITDHDFKVVNTASIGAIFLIILFVFKSISLPVILVAIIEFAITINMGIPMLTNTTLPFIASIVIGTIQLGSTVDYAILMTTRYKKERSNGATKAEAVRTAHAASISSIIASALSFFAATIGVGLYSKIDMISSLCILLSRGAIISMFVVLLVLPSALMLFDGIITHTSLGFLPKKDKKEAQS